MEIQRDLEFIIEEFDLAINPVPFSQQFDTIAFLHVRIETHEQDYECVVENIHPENGYWCSIITADPPFKLGDAFWVRQENIFGHNVDDI